MLSDGNLGYIVAAYGLVWTTLGLYVVRRWRRLAALAREGAVTAGEGGWQGQGGGHAR